MDAFKLLICSELVDTIVQQNPDLAEIVKAVKDKLNNPNPLSDDDGSSESDSDPEEEELDDNDSCKNTEEEAEKRNHTVARILVYN